MIKKNNLNNSEASLNYFLVQSFASAIFLFSIIIFIIDFKIIFYITMIDWLDINLLILIELISLTLILKLGVAPFHFWFPNVIENISWINNIILITWQKIPSIIILMYIINCSFFYIIFILITTFVGAIGGLNQISLRKILSFSSINHIGWIIIALIFNENIWIIYFLIYSFLNICIILTFKIFQIFYLNQIYSFFINSYFLKFRLIVPLISLGGLPPFLGFFPKWIIIQSIIYINISFIIIFIIIISLITLYYYLKIGIASFIFNYDELNWRLKNYYNSQNLIFILNTNFISLFGFFILINVLNLI